MNIPFPPDLTFTLLGANPLAAHLAHALAERGIGRLFLGEADLFAPEFLPLSDFHAPDLPPNATAHLEARLRRRRPETRIEVYSRKLRQDSFGWLQSAVQQSDLIVDASSSGLAAQTLNRLSIEQTRPALYLKAGTILYVMPRCTVLATRFGVTPCWECAAKPRPSTYLGSGFPIDVFLDVALALASAITDPDSPFHPLIDNQPNMIEVTAPSPVLGLLEYEAEVHYRERRAPSPECRACSPMLVADARPMSRSLARVS